MDWYTVTVTKTENSLNRGARGRGGGAEQVQGLEFEKLLTMQIKTNLQRKINFKVAKNLYVGYQLSVHAMYQADFVKAL